MPLPFVSEYIAITTPSSSGNTDLTMTADRTVSAFAGNVDAGTSPYVHSFSLTGAPSAGAILHLRLNMPESRNPKIEIRDMSPSGALLGIVPVTGYAFTYSGVFVFNGTNWEVWEASPLAEKR